MNRNQLRIVSMVMCMVMLLVAVCPGAAYAAQSDDGFITEQEEAVFLLRDGMKQRQETISMSYEISEGELNDSYGSVMNLADAIFEQAVAHTGDPLEGDYLYWDCDAVDMGARYYIQNDVYWITYSFELDYYTSAAQEEALNAEIEELVVRLKLDQDISDYQKIFNIYHYICSHVEYDYEHLDDSNYDLKYTAYAALMDKSAVCQGYAVLFYRLALEAGIDSRVIAGVASTSDGEVGHAWNMVELDGAYYYLDSTWDAVNTDSAYFLKTKDDFSEHYPDQQYESEAFFAEYPMHQMPYTFAQTNTNSISLGHTVVAEDKVEATCEADGLTAGTCCASCGEIFEGREVIPAVGHEYKSAVTAATCGAQGYTTYTCTVCSDNYAADYTDATGEHSYTNDKDDSCNQCGYIRDVRAAWIVAMYRMYNPNTGEHFYTGSTEERDNLVLAGWNYEGEGFRFYGNDPDPVYRLFEPATGEHLYTMDESEKNNLLEKGWQYEGVAFNSASADEAPQYRLHNPNATVGAYHFTNSTEEREHLLSLGWEYQGIGWYSLLK